MRDIRPDALFTFEQLPLRAGKSSGEEVIPYLLITYPGVIPTYFAQSFDIKILTVFDGAKCTETWQAAYTKAVDLSTPLVRTKPANHLMRRVGWSFLAIGTCTCLYWATDWATVTRPGQPRLLASEIVNAADSATGDVAPGEIVRLLTSNAGPVSLVGSQQGNGARLPLVLGDTRVLFDGVPAPLLWAVRGEIAAGNAIMAPAPRRSVRRERRLRVRNICSQITPRQIVLSVR